MGVKAVDHLGFVVPDLDKMQSVLTSGLGVRHLRRSRNEGFGVMVDFYTVGEQVLVVEQPVEPWSPMARFMEKRGPGINHVALAVDDLDAVLVQVRAQGLRVLDLPMTQQGRKEVIIHPKDSHGVLLQLIEWQGQFREASATERILWNTSPNK